MSITTAEHLSAVLDGEAGDFEQRRILDELGKDESLQSSLSCYALIGETMRDESQVSIAGMDFLKGIHDEINEEPEYSHVQIIEKKASNDGAWVRPVTGFAVAASVAALAVVGMQSFMSGNNGSASSLAENTQSKMTSSLVASADTYRHPDKKTQTLYKHYLDSHVQYASTTSMMPSIRVVSYNSNY
ncbi:MAG TPA: hypothetical protein EYG68_05815 [Leucothrix mucor]|nr:hypothetical protein [Leucothrix mucor]